MNRVNRDHGLLTAIRDPTNSASILDGYITSLFLTIVKRNQITEYTNNNKVNTDNNFSRIAAYSVRGLLGSRLLQPAVRLVCVLLLFI